MTIAVSDLKEGKPYVITCRGVNERDRREGMWWCGRTCTGWFHPDCYYSGLYHLEVVTFRSDDLASIFIVAVEDIIDIAPIPESRRN